MVALPFIAKAAGIVVDGSTATTVLTVANGGQTVNIAPAVSGVSQNTYSSFNVSTADATLNVRWRSRSWASSGSCTAIRLRHRRQSTKRVTGGIAERK
jgi:hypothetical protein